MRNPFANSLAILLTASSLAGCALGSGSGASTVAQGQRYESGNADYDAFFRRVHRLQLEVGRAPQELSEAQNSLRSSVIVGENMTAETLALQVKLELDRLARRGVPVRVTLRAGEPTTTSARAVFAPQTAPRPADAQLLTQLEGGVSRHLVLVGSMRKARDELDALCSDALRLEGRLNSTFSAGLGGRRGTVLENLRDAERVLALMRAQADETRRNADAFVVAFGKSIGQPMTPDPARPNEGDAERLVRVATPSPPTRAAPAKPEAATAAAPVNPAPSDSVTRADFEP